MKKENLEVICWKARPFETIIWVSKRIVFFGYTDWYYTNDISR